MEILNLEKSMEKGYWDLQMEVYIEANGKMEWEKEKEFWLLKMEVSMMESSKIIYFMDKESSKASYTILKGLMRMD